MGETEKTEIEAKPRRKRSGVWWGILAPMASVAGALALLAIIYLSYDVVRAEFSPCDTIFQQTSVGLSTRIQLLKIDGELKIGREATADLDERAQMVALDLKTCCTVLDAGRINPEQFLQCKAKARTYDARIENISALVGALPLGGAKAGPAAGASTTPVSSGSIAEAVEAARAASRDLNEQVVQVAKDQALQMLQGIPPANVSIDATEREPNNDVLSANLIDLNKLVSASIGTPTAADVYTFVTPNAYRDWIRIELQNRSTTLHPNLELFDAAKTSLGASYNATPGGDASYEFVAPPATRFSIRVSDHYGQSTGVYLIRVAPEKAYEPNDDILSAKRLGEGTPIMAKIMDKDDVDYFVIDGAGGGDRALAVTIANKSVTLHPNAVVYDASKTEIGSAHNATAGGDLSYPFKATKGPIYVRVSDYYNQSSGDYTLAVQPQ